MSCVGRVVRLGLGGLVILAAGLCPAADKSGVSPTTVSVPSGPGTIEGLGPSFQPMLNTGSARYAVTFRLPAGTAGHNPHLILQYDSGLGMSAVAPGWTVGPKSIRRRVDKGIPRYIDGPNGLDDDLDGRIDEPDEIDVFVGPDGEELVPLENGFYRARIEGAFARFKRVDQGWLVDLKNGVKLTYGTTNDSRITPADGAGIFGWLPDRSTDPNGNVVDYFWAPLPGSDSQKYLCEIRYGPGSPPWEVFYFVKLIYESRPDRCCDFRSGFPIVTAHRLTRVEIGIQGLAPELCAGGDWNGDGVPDALVGRYELAYAPIGPAVSQLVRITRFGSDGINSLPPVRFRYASFFPGPAVSASASVLSSENTPDTVMDSGLVDLVDLNRDGLPDILKTDAYGGGHVAHLNLGERSTGAGRTILWDAPQSLDSPERLASALQLAQDRVALADMDGDGISDLVHNTLADEVFYFANRGNVSWGPRTPMSARDTAPPAPFARENVKTADLDFNQRIDVVQSTETGYACWLNQSDGVYSRELRTDGARYEGSVIQFSDEGVDLADMNGDRLVDVAKVTPYSVVYAPGMGHGKFFTVVVMPIPDTVLSDGDDGQIARAKLTDANGDGLSDLVIERAVPGRLWCWLNLGSGRFSNRITVGDMPAPFGGDTAVRWADMNGNGSTDLVYADSNAAQRIRVVDLGEVLGGSAHPYLLTGIENGLGVTTAISWGGSTEQALADAADDAPWTSTVPFPVHVVTRVDVDTGLDQDLVPGKDRYQKHYRYRDGFYDDRERQFRGFARVTVTEEGDETAPTAVSVSAFFTGGPDGADNDGDGEIDEVSDDDHREEEALKGMVRAFELRDDAGALFHRGRAPLAGEGPSRCRRRRQGDPAGGPSRVR